MFLPGRKRPQDLLIRLNRSWGEFWPQHESWSHPYPHHIFSSASPDMAVGVNVAKYKQWVQLIKR